MEMETQGGTGRFAPKVHPLSRSATPDDPMDLNAAAVPGDPDVLINALVQEYAWMGWDGDEIAALFHDPFYPMLHGLLEALGETGVRDRINAVFNRDGVFRFRTTVHEAPDDHDHEPEPEVVQIGAFNLKRKEQDHVDGL